ncbi:DUF1212-domain-containing protein [Amylostereum chailletii]|nr:DUF1212-domain-containing protein [Amylostereum chailletii]
MSAFVSQMVTHRLSTRGLDSDDPINTGLQHNNREVYEDLKERCRRQMGWGRMRCPERRCAAQQLRIKFNICTAIQNHHRFLITLARALIAFGAPSHRVNSQLAAAARVLDVQAEFIYLPGVIFISFGDSESGTSVNHIIKSNGRLSLDALRTVHQIYRRVMRDKISAKEGALRLEATLAAAPIYGNRARCLITFCLSALICVTSFGGSLLDMCVSGILGLTCLFQISLAKREPLLANFYEITVILVVSFLARALSSIRNNIFCYSAIAYASIVTVELRPSLFPGFAILTSSFELASENVICGAVRMSYAIVYALFLGFSIQIGKELHQINGMLCAMTRKVIYTGTVTMDKISSSTSDIPTIGSFTFVHGSLDMPDHIIAGCYRSETFRWSLQPWPVWARFILVPFVHHFVFLQFEIVSSAGAFVVGILGNIYSRQFSGTGFTCMVTAVLFLVPNGLSTQVGGFMDGGNGLEVGVAMANVSIRITVGLFTSQAMIYAFGGRKAFATFSLSLFERT